MRWWSTFESLWANVTVFDRAARMLRVARVRELTLDDPALSAGADVLGLEISAA